ncbi:MAG: ATP-dependent helicase/nuclease subunit [Hyphomicrobiales bacterium]|jgi:ATP-dependent helicase/nuclease subunit B|nr:ATP-dependent helicase/nuclease subunit [Hyphomicrobiales bacterium]
MPARVFTIPASAPFLPTLIGALKEGRLIAGFPVAGGPLSLAIATLFLPTRRAGQLARAAFLEALGKDAAVVLPRIVPLGEIDEDELVFASAAAGAEALEVPQALGDLERRMVLARLVQQWIASPGLRTGTGNPLVANTPASALALADALARLIDDMTTRQVPWDKLDTLVPPEFDAYWQKTLDFLQIARTAWPAILEERRRIEPAARRDLLIEAERQRLLASDGPVIAAGSTGSMPATAKLLDTIAKLPHGVVVLPGLDTALDARSWDLIGGLDDDAATHGHPQFAMHGLLKRMGITRDDVVMLGETHARERLLSEALRPASSTERWAARGADAARRDAFDCLAMIEAANAEEEALAVAVALREAVEHGKTAALVTPDRALARRVGAALARWNIVADDSGGDALPETQAGVFARLAAQVVFDDLPPVGLLALVQHARFRLDAEAGAHARAIATLERAVLRGPRPRPGAQGLAGALARFREELGKFRRKEPTDLHGSDPRTTISNADLDAAQAFVASLAGALAPLEGLKSRHSFVALAKLHSDVLTSLSRDQAGVPAAFAGDDGVALAEAFMDIAGQLPDDVPHIGIADYAELFEATIAPRVCRRPGSPGERVRILGPLEARLVTVDRVVLGGLVEGVWPPDTRTDPWLSRPMRLALGLDLPERRIGLSAHDFAQLAGTREVILTRAAKLGGAPTVASRFVQRLAAVAGEQWTDAIKRGAQYVEWARHIDRAESIKPAPRPRPRPPLAARPAQLSVTEIENLLRDPYTVYAKHILGLRPLDAVDTPPGARDRGTLIHGAIGEFTEIFAQGLPPDPLGELLALGEKHFAPLRDFPEARAFWWPRFVRIARWFVAWEALRRADTTEIHAEMRGKLDIEIDNRVFRLITRADRIERFADGSFAILDYKTGTIPTEPQVRTGLSPQLTLEGAILRQGGFENLKPGSLTELAYVSLRGRDPGGEAKRIEFKDGTADFHADKALARLKGVLARFANPKEPYRSLVSPMWKTRYGDYDHLARVAEWSAGGEDEEGVE